MLVQIDYELTFTTQFHLGTGIRRGLIDRTVIRNSANQLYVPASTFKGVLREHCENLLRFYTNNEGIDSPHNTSATLAEFGQKPTLISRIFGSSLYPGTLRFKDAMLHSQFQNAAYQQMQTSFLTQARIDRITRIAAEQALYSSEFGMRDFIFQGSIKGQLDCTTIPPSLLSITNAPDQETETFTPTYSLLLLLAGLLLIERLGGNKSTGKGQCTCTITKLMLDRQECDKQEWQIWIEHLEVLTDYLQREKGA